MTRANAALGAAATLTAAGDVEHCVLSLRDEVALGDAIAKLSNAGVRVLACREERPGVEVAFLRLTQEEL